MLFLAQSAAVYGIDALIVDIEVNLQPVAKECDKVFVIIVGLPDPAIRESRERIRAAITNSRYFFPFHKTTINLAPADVRKEGASFDLPIALGVLGANGDLGDAEGLTDVLSVGELSLDGRVRPVRGALPVALRARDAGIRSLLLPEENGTEAAVELTKIHSVAGLTNRTGLVNARPFRSPHHTISDGGLVGGGVNYKR